MAGRVLVIEADESDRSFLSIASQVALITNIDLDHTDVHANLDSLTADFKQFAAGALNSGG
jgi:UDP-N-acetylmuramate--alanine ligase